MNPVYEIDNDLKSDSEILEGYLKGSLNGVYVRDDCFFINLRVTGLGVTKRLDEEQSRSNLLKVCALFKDVENAESLNLERLIELVKNKNLQPSNFISWREVDRKEQDFASTKTLELYNGLPIVLDHPSSLEGNTLLTFNNLSYNPIVGSVMKAYKRANAVFAIARIYDLSVLDYLKEFKSTSPAVVSVEVEENGCTKELPFAFNHLAFVRDGHWDQLSTFAMDTSKIIIAKGEGMDKIDAITDVVAAPEIKQTNVDDFEHIDNVDVVDSDEVTHLDNVDVVDSEGFEHIDNVDVVDSDEVTHLDNVDVVDSEGFEHIDNVDVVDSEGFKRVDGVDVAIDSEGFGHIDNADVEGSAHLDNQDAPRLDGSSKKLLDELKAANASNVTKSVECDEDKERESLVSTMRETVDAVSLRDVRMPYIEGRKKPSFVVKAFLRSNRKYVDAKYASLLDDTSASYKNYSLCIDAFNGMLENIKAQDKANKAYYATEAAKQKGWVVTSNPNVSVDRNF